METENLMCAGCENNDCEFFTIHKGTLLCSYCLEDWMDYGAIPDNFQFHRWLIHQREKMKKDRGELND